MKRILRVVAMGAAVVMLTAPARALWGKAETKTESANAPSLGEYKGIKHAIGVKGFSNDSGWAGQWKVGDNLTSMLESALFDTGRFVVVQREQLRDVIQEQDLVASGRAAPARGVAQTGRIRPARYLAGGAITEISENQSGGDAGIRVRGVRVGGGRSEAQVTVVVTLTDTTTGEIVAKESVVGKAGRTALRVGYSGAIGGELGGFQKTPLGQAAQDVINQAVAVIAKKMEEFPATGNVVRVTDQGQVIINRGSEYGAQEGTELALATEGEVLMDPESGEVLGREEGRVISKIKITRVQEKMSYADILEGEKNPPVGTLVRAP
jgi:curli biogenesis system outer membrane secretion channel CsgG